MKLSTVTQSHANEIKHKYDNRFREHFNQIFASQNTRNGVSGHQDFKIFWGSCMSKTPIVARPYRARLIRRWLNKIHIYILKKLDSLSFCVNMVPSRNLDYIFYSAFDSSKGKNRLDNGQNATNLEITILGKLNISKNSGGSSKFPGGLNVIHTTTQTAFVSPVREYFF